MYCVENVWGNPNVVGMINTAQGDAYGYHVTPKAFGFMLAMVSVYATSSLVVLLTSYFSVLLIYMGAVACVSSKCS